MFNNDLKILLVEDNDDHAHLVERLLRKMGGAIAQIERQTSLAEATRLLQERQYDMVLLDLSLPDSDIAQTLDEFLKVANDEPVICLTSTNDLEFATQAVQKGAQDYLVKGTLTKDLLLRSMRYAIERHKYSIELERSNDELRQFAGTVAHEVRSPLSVIVTGCEVIRMHLDEDPPEGVTDILETMEGAARGMTELVSELLEFAQIESDQSTFENVDMESIFHYVVALNRGLIEETGAKLTNDPLPVVSGNASHMRHLLQNLIGNALKYRKPDEPPRVHVTSEEDGSDWRFCVSDNGIGIAAHEHRRIFEAFKRAEGNNAPGTGIGLAFCQRIVDHHGGRIWVESSLGEGSRFCFTLPISKND